MTAVVITNPNRLGYIKQTRKRIQPPLNRRRIPRLWALAGQVPTLDLDFTQRTIVDRVSGTLTPTFTRPSSVKLLSDGKQLVSYAADVPGFELRNRVWEYSHEPAATNLYTNNRTFTISSGHTLQTSGGQRLDGAGALVKLVPNNGQDPSASSNAGVLAGSTVSLVDATQYTQSIYAKAAELNQVRIRSNASGQLYTFTLGSAPPAPTGSITASTSELITDGWYRLSWTFLSTSTAPGNRTDHWSVRAAVTGDGTSGFFVDLGQVELGPSPTSPIITSGSAVTRNADTMTISGVPFTNFYNQLGGVLYVEFSRTTHVSGLFPNLFSINDGTGSNSIVTFLLDFASRYQYTVNTLGSAQVAFNQSAISAENVTHKAALRALLNDGALAVNGAVTGVDTVITMPTVNQLQIGSNPQGQLRLRRLIYWPPGPAQSRLKQLTA